MALRSPRFPQALALAALITVSVPAAERAAAGDTITGVCPDGSMFIVKRAADIPCDAALEVAPQEMPPIRPEYLPRPYGWQVFQERQDPNNPYNLVEAARRIRESGAPTLYGDSQAGQPPPEPEVAPPVSAAPPLRTARREPVEPRPSSARDLGLSEGEIRDLILIVELGQSRAPATFASEGSEAVVLRLARSEAFATRMQQARGAALGPVLLFTAVAERAGTFHPHLTFVQGHQAFQVNPDDPSQLGILHGAPGPLEVAQAVLGYVVLPSSLDLGQPMDVYWNDRMLRATLAP